MSEEKRTPESLNDKALNDITDDFGDIFSEIKEKNDTLPEENQPEQESAIRGIFGRIKKKNSRQSDSMSKPESESQKKTSSMKLSESQEILDLSQKVTESIKKEAVVVVEAEEKTNGITTITMKIPKLTDEKLAEISKEQKQAEASEKPAKEKAENKKIQAEKAQAQKQESSDEIENIGDILKKPEITEEQAEQPSDESDISENYSEDLPQDTDEKPSFKTKLSKFLSSAKEKALYYLGFEDDEDYEDDVIFSTSSGVERSKNANPLDFDEAYKENIVYQAPAEEKKDDKPDLLKVAAQNTTINNFDLSDDKSEEIVVKTENESKVSDKPISVEIKEKISNEPIQDKTEEKMSDKPISTKAKVEIKDELITDKIKEEISDKPITAEIKTETKPYAKKNDSEDLTFDEILAEEKRNRISIDIALDDGDTMEDAADSPLSDQLDFSILAEQIAGDVLREPRKPKKSQKAKPSETEAKSEETTKPSEAEVKSEETAKPSETEAKSEETAKPSEAEAKSEETTKPSEAEVKSEETAKPSEAEAKSEETAKPSEAEVKSEETTKPSEAEVKSEETTKQSEAEVKSEETTKPSEADAKSEETAKSREAEIKSEETTKPSEAEVKSEETAKPSEAEAKSEETDIKFEDVARQIKAEANAEKIVSSVKDEAKTQANDFDFDSPFIQIIDMPKRKHTEDKSNSEPSEQTIIDEIKSEPSKQTVVDEIKSEPSEQTIIDEIKSEPSKQTVVDEIKPEPRKQPVVDEIKTEPSEQIIVDEVKPEPSEQSVVDEIKSEPSEQSVVDEIKSEPSEQTVVDEINTEPSEQSVVDEIKSESSKQLVVDEIKTESSKQPVVDEIKPESSKQPVVDEIKPEPSKQPVVDEIKTEPSKQTVVDEVKPEPIEQSVVDEIKTEPSEQSVVDEIKSESIEQPVVDEIKSEPSKQTIVDEVKPESSEQSVVDEIKSESSKQPVVDEIKSEQKQTSSVNPLIKIVDKAQPKQSVTRDKAKPFNPVIIQSEKPIQEFKLDFAKEYQDVPKTMLTYKRPSEKSNFVVMAGKFTKTVRSEYRAYRYRPKPPEPPTSPDIKQNPPTDEKPKQQTKNDESGKSSFLGEFSFKKHKKKPESEQQPVQRNEPEQQPIQKNEPKPQSKPQAEQKHTSVVKPIHKQETQPTKSEEAPKIKLPKPPIPKPKMPVVPPVVKSVVPGFMRKKQRPEIMPDIKKKEEPVQPKPEKTDSKPKAEKKEKNKTSEARKAIKKKTQMLKLFSSDEDLDMDDFELNEENREIEEYSSKNDEREIRSEINNNYRKLTLRSIIVSIGLVFSVTLDILVGVMSETFMNMPFGWLLVAFLNAIILCVCVVACYVPIINGIVPLRHFKANSDTSLAVASFAGILQAFVSFFSPESFINGYLHYYTTLVILGLLLNCIGRMLIIIRVHDNFKFIMKNPELYAGKIYTDERNAKKMFSGAPLNKPLIAYRKKTKFLSNFLQLSYAPDPSENIAAKIAPVTSVIALTAALIYAFIAGGVAEGASAFALFAIILTPVCQLIAVNLPIKKLCSAVLKKGSMVTSYESVKQFCDTNAVIIDSNDLYPSGTVTMSGIKTFSGSKVDDAIRGAAAVMLAVKAPMSSMFDNIIKSKRDTLPHVESVIYEDGLGLVGWVAGQRILLGNRRLLEAHGIKVPPADYEKKYTDKSKQAVYLSLGGELVAMFIVTYKGSSAIAEELRNLEQNGVTLLVRTIDSNITQDRIAEDFGVFYRSVKILPTGLGNITKEMTDTPDEETRAYIATKGGIQSFARAISGCIRIKSNVTLSIFLQMAGIFLGFVLVGVITFIAGIARLNILELLILYVFSIIVGIVAPIIRKP